MTTLQLDPRTGEELGMRSRRTQARCQNTGSKAYRKRSPRTLLKSNSLFSCQSKASAIRTLAMKAGVVHADINQRRGFNESPFRLLPIIDAMEVSTNTDKLQDTRANQYREMKKGHYKALHTINVDMQ
jgi:hypothetical protein